MVGGGGYPGIEFEVKREINKMSETVMLGGFSFLCGVIAAKWGMELGVSQLTQLALLVCGLFLGPVLLLLMYIFLVYKFKREGRPGTQFIGR